jgi:predicted RNase H-like HicB family nuclease
MKFMALTFVAYGQEGYCVSECQELGTSSFGTSEQEALDHLLDATKVYLNPLEDLGETGSVLEDLGVKTLACAPAFLEIDNASFPMGSVVKPTVMSLHPVEAVE